MKSAELIIDSSEKNIDLYYITGFHAPDAFVYFRTAGKKYMMMNDLEIDRAKKTANVNNVLSLTKYMEKAKSICKNPSRLDATITALRDMKVKKIIVPESMSFVSVDYLRKKGFKVEAGPSTFYPQRLIKNKTELNHIINAQKAVFSSIKTAEDLIKKSVAKNNGLYLDGKPLTSEGIKKAIELHLYEKGYISTEEFIVACGNDSVDPHNTGSGQLKPHSPIIVDVFPKSVKSKFFGDATRTFCKGKAPAELKKLYNTVKKAQEDAIKKIKAGINGKNVHQNILDFFEKNGYPTREMDGRMQGFFHSTGHGIGLELHESPPRIAAVDCKMKEGYVVSVEPGLYYKKTGGVRIEDLIYVTKTGCKVLGYYPKQLEIL